MSDKSTIDEILDFAIGEEEKAAKFYSFMAEKVDRQWMKDLFKDFAREEVRHKEKLLEFKESGIFESSAKGVRDLKIGDYLVDMEPSPEMSYQDALILAMKKEKAAFRFYSDLAAASTDAAVKKILGALAEEEAKHKLRFEIEYDEKVLTEN